MRTKRLGSGGPEISVVGYGAWEAGEGVWGPNPSEDQVVDAIRTGLDAGISWIDTAEVYGRGLSERLVGRAIADRRDEVFLATKVAPRPAGSGFRPEEVARACRGSLERLEMEVIDLYQLHWQDRSGIRVEDTWGAMAGLVDKGLVRHIGVSNFDQDLIERCEAVRHVDSLQAELSMLWLDERDLIAWCGERGIGAICYGSLAYGLLTDAISKDTEFHEQDWRGGGTGVSYYRRLFGPGKLERSLSVVDGMRPIAERLDVTLGQLALAWVFHQPGVTGAIAGTRNPDHVRENAEAGDIELDDETLEELEGLLSLGPAA